MFLFPSHRGYRHAAVANKSKDEIAIDDMAFKFKPILQTFMKNAGYDFEEREIYNVTFLTFKHLTVLTLSQRALYNASMFILETTEEVRQCFDRLTKSSSSHYKNDAKMMKAIDIMNQQIQRHIKHIMHYAGFEEHETEENDKAFVQFLSKFIILETDKVFLDMARFRSSEQLTSSSMSSSQAMPNVSNDNCFQHLPMTSTSSMTLVANAKKHILYLISPENNVLKILKSNNPTWKDVENLDNELKVSNHILHPAFR